MGREQVASERFGAPGMGERLRQAMPPERTAAAARFEYGRGDRTRSEQGVQTGDGRLGLRAEEVAERDLAPLAAQGMVDGSIGHGDVKHLLQAKRLGAELYVVIGPAARPPAFVLDRVGDRPLGATVPRELRAFVELDQVSTTVEPKPLRDDPEAALGSHAGPPLNPHLVGAAMADITLARVLVVNVESVKVPQGRPTITIQVGVDSREGDEVVPLCVVGLGHERRLTGYAGRCADEAPHRGISGSVPSRPTPPCRDRDDSR